MQLLPKVPSAADDSHEARAINESGVVAGRYNGASNGVFLWSASTGTIDLGAPAGYPEYVDINDSGDVVATIIQAGLRQAFLYRDGTWTNLNDLRPPGSSFLIQRAMAINNLGWIVGDGGEVNANSGFVLIPPSANQAPVAQDELLSATEDVQASGQLTATDAEGDALTFSIVSNGSLGSVVISNSTTGAFTYTPAANANGTDSFTFTASDGILTSSVATVTIEIYPRVERPFFQRAFAEMFADEDAAVGLAIPPVVRAWIAAATFPPGVALALMPWSIEIR